MAGLPARRRLVAGVVYGGALRPEMSAPYNTKLPRCHDCGGPAPRVVGRETYDQARRRRIIVHEWLCAGCEYKREHPDAREGIAEPRLMRPLKLQRETLF